MINIKSQPLPFVTVWMEVQNITASHISSTQTAKRCNLSLICGVSNNQTDRYREEYGNDTERELGTGEGDLRAKSPSEEKYL